MILLTKNDQETIEPSIAAAEQEETPQETTPSGEAETSSEKEDEAGSPGTAFFEKEDVRYPAWSYEYKDPNSDICDDRGLPGPRRARSARARLGLFPRDPGQGRREGQDGVAARLKAER